MAFWTDASIELKRKSRFIVEIASGFFLPNVKTCTKPSANVDIKEFQLINHKFKYPGIVTWGDIKITMIDMRGRIPASAGEKLRSFGQGPPDEFALDTSLLLWKILKYTGYNYPTNELGLIGASGDNLRQLSTPEKASTIANGFGTGLYNDADFQQAGVGQRTNRQAVKIYTLGPEGRTVEKWTLHNPQIKSINWGDHSYESDEFVEYSIDIAYDWAEHDKSNGESLEPLSIGQQYQAFINQYQGRAKAVEDERNEVKRAAQIQSIAQAGERRYREQTLAGINRENSERQMAQDRADEAAAAREFRAIQETESKRQEMQDILDTYGQLGGNYTGTRSRKSQGSYTQTAAEDPNHLGDDVFNKRRKND